MKKIQCVLALLLMSMAGCSNFLDSYKDEGFSGQISSPLTRGREFYIAFFQNIDMPGYDIYFTLYITSEHNTTGTVTIPSLGMDIPFSVAAHGIAAVTIPNSIMVASNDTVESLGIHVVSDNPVTVYGLDRQYHVSDGFMALPVTALDNEYYVLSYTTSQNVVEGGSLFGIVATRDNTTITITPAITSGPRAAGVPYSIIMNTGQTYQLKDLSGSSDMTGTHIVSDNPIAVFTAVPVTNIPWSVQSGDFLLEQLWPVSRWGSEFYFSSTSPAIYSLRIMACIDNTSVLVNGTASVIAGAGGFIEQARSDSVHVNASEPVLVAVYAHGCGELPANPDYIGDPSMVLLPPTEWHLGNYTFSTGDSIFQYNYMNITVPTAAIGSLQLDGAAVDPVYFAPIDGSYSGAMIPVTPGSHRITGSHGFGLIIFGNAQRESYIIPGG